MTTRLAERMRQAADAMEEASALYGYHRPDLAPWTPQELRTEAMHVEEEGQ